MRPGVPLVSNRSLILQRYPTVENADGGFTFVISSKESDELYKKYADRIGKDVIAVMEGNIWVFKPIEGGGTRIT